MYYKTTYQSPVGTLTLASDGENLVGLWIEGQKYHGETIYKDMTVKNDVPVFNGTKKWLDRYFNGDKPCPHELQIAFDCSDFRRDVLGILREIPYGKLTTYGEVAKKIALKAGKQQMSSRAVGGAVGHNPVSIIIPCHRVVGSNGSLTGYSAGVKTKAKLLELEGVDVQSAIR